MADDMTSKKPVVLESGLREALPLVVWSTDATGLVESSSGPKAQDQSGIPQVGHRIDDWTAGDSGLLAATRAGLEGRTVTTESTLGDRVYSVTIGPRRSETGAVIGTTAVGIDLTELHSARRDLAVRDEQLQTLMETALDALITCDTRSTIIGWNHEAEKIFGWTREEAVGQTLTETIIPPDLRGAHSAGMKRYLESGEGPVLGRRIEIEAVDRSGRRFPVELGINPIPTSAGLMFSAFIRDITERVGQEQRLLGSEYRLRNALAAMKAGAWDYRLDADGMIVEAITDDRTREILGDDAAVPPAGRTRIHDADRAEVAKAWSEHLVGEVSRYAVEYRRIGDDGDVVWVRELGSLVEIEEDEADAFAGQLRRPRRMIGVVEDVTSAKLLEASLLDARKLEAVGTVASQFAHDLNNMLTAISGHVSLAEIVDGVPDRVRTSLDVIKGAVTRGRAITQNMLQLSRPHASGRRAGQIDCRRLVEETTRLAAPMLGNDIALEVEIQPDSPGVIVDGGQVQQAILNLLINARDAMDGRGAIRLSIHEFEDADSPIGARYLAIEVADDGPGMSPEVLEKAAMPFYTTKGSKGTGLGLSMIEGLVRAEGGRLVIESSEGVGTVIRMLFPVAVKTTRDSTWSKSRVRRVLVVEDHPLLRPMLEEALSHAGCEVDSCADGEAAMATITEFTPDILVVDVNLPGVRGDQVAQQLRERIGRQVPVLFITGNNDFELPDWPSVRLIRKPFELPDFTELVLGSLAN